MPNPRRSIGSAGSVDAAAALLVLRRQLDVHAVFPAEVESRAVHSAQRGPQAVPGGHTGRVDRRDLEMVTLDPAGSRDLDQAFVIERRGDGYRLFYAIADVAAFVAPGDAVDEEARRRGTTLYLPDGRAPLHPPMLSEGAASLLEGQDRPAVLWQLDLDDAGMLVDTSVGRALVRSRRALSYPQAQQMVDRGGDALLVLLAEVGQRRLAAEAARGGVSLALAEQEVLREPNGHYRLVYRASLAVERWNAQLSLLTGMAAAELMLRSGHGLLRTLPAPLPRVVEELRREASILGIGWPPGETTRPGFGCWIHRCRRGLRCSIERRELFEGPAMRW